MCVRERERECVCVRESVSDITLSILYLNHYFMCYLIILVIATLILLN